MRPYEFRDAMKKIQDKQENNPLGFDMEDAHIEMDELMCEVLTFLGYHEGVEIFKQVPKWYA